MIKKIEVEIRGPIKESDYKRLNRFFLNEGHFIDHKNRIAICYPDPETGSYVENLKSDIRVRSTNGIPELIIKKGKWGGKESREELSLKITKGEFDKLVMIMGALGFKKGITVVRNGKIFDYKGIEFSLVQVPNHSYYFEAEVMVTKKSEVKKTRENMETICKKLGLTLFDDKDFYNYINKLNAEANVAFDFEKYKPGNFKKKFGI